MQLRRAKHAWMCAGAHPSTPAAAGSSSSPRQRPGSSSSAPATWLLLLLHRSSSSPPLPVVDPSPPVELVPTGLLLLRRSSSSPPLLSPHRQSHHRSSVTDTGRRENTWVSALTKPSRSMRALHADAAGSTTMPQQRALCACRTRYSACWR
jgi:hypothetical protein